MPRATAWRVRTYTLLSLLFINHIHLLRLLRGQAGRPRVADAVQSTGFIPGSASKIGAFGPPRVAVAQREAFSPLWVPRTGLFRLFPVTPILVILPQNALKQGHDPP